MSHEEYVSLNESIYPSHINTHIPRGTGRGGGVAAIFDSSLLINPKAAPPTQWPCILLCASYLIGPASFAMPVYIYIHIYTLPFKSLGSLRNVLIFQRKALFFSMKMTLNQSEIHSIHC